MVRCRMTWSTWSSTMNDQDTNTRIRGFKALKQLVKLAFKQEKYDEMISRFRQLLTYTKSAVTKNQAEHTITRILEHISYFSKRSDIVKQMYEITLESLKENKNEV